MRPCLPFLLFALASESTFGGPGDGKEPSGAPAPQLPDAAAVRKALNAGRFDMSGWWQMSQESKATRETGFRFYMKIERGQPGLLGACAHGGCGSGFHFHRGG